MDATPNTINYMIAGYVVFAVVITVYVFSLFRRWQNLRTEMQLIEEIGKKK